MSRRLLIWVSTVLIWLASSVQAVELVMIDAAGCHYCHEWKREIGPIYPKTEQGKFAPLRIVDAYHFRDANIKIARGVAFTPTFLIVDNNKELARIEGYPGDEFFWTMLDQLLKKHTDYGKRSHSTQASRQ